MNPFHLVIAYATALGLLATACIVWARVGM